VRAAWGLLLGIWPPRSSQVEPYITRRFLPAFAAGHPLLAFVCGVRGIIAWRDIKAVRGMMLWIEVISVSFHPHRAVVLVYHFRTAVDQRSFTLKGGSPVLSRPALVRHLQLCRV